MMLTSIDKLMQSGCEREKKEKICRARGGESCAFDGAMIVLQPIADAAHIVHGPIACCGNSWEGRGTLSSKGDLHKMGFTTDMNEMDIVYGSEAKLYKAILNTCEAVKPKAVFVYATCVSGLIGEDIEAVCKKAEQESGVRVIPVNAPGFIGPKNLGNRIAGEVLLDHVIGTGEPPPHLTPPLSSPCQGEDGWGIKGGIVINLIGEYNIAGDLWLVEPILNKAGIRVLSRITGNSTFGEITYAHRAKLNVVVCSRALINVAKEMERKYGIPYVEVSFFGKTEMSKALTLIASKLELQIINSKFKSKVEEIIEYEEKSLEKRLKAYEHLRGKKAVLYTGGVKSWSFISALLDLGIEIVAVGTKKSTLEDEDKMKEILGEDAPLIEDVTPKNLLRILKEKNADMLVAGGRNQYFAVKEGYPFVDVNQERHIAYAGYDGLVNLAEQISSSIRFYNRKSGVMGQESESNPPLPPFTKGGHGGITKPESAIKNRQSEILINPLKHSPSIGAAMAFQGIHKSLPIIHGAQGCAFLGKVLLTKHFREPIALASTKLFTEQVVIGSDEQLITTIREFIEKNKPDVIGILSSGLSEVKGDDAASIIKQFKEGTVPKILYISTPDYEGGIETGYAKAVEALLEIVGPACNKFVAEQVNVLAGSHLTPADFTEMREILESFGLKPVMLPDLSALDGSRQGLSALATGGTRVEEIQAMSASSFTLAIGLNMELPANILKEKFGIEYKIFESISGLKDTDMLMETLSMLSGKQTPAKYERQRRILNDAMRDAHFYYGNKKVCLAIEPDISVQISRVIEEMGARVELAVIPYYSTSVSGIHADNIMVGDLFSIEGDFHLLVSNSHAEDTAKRLSVPLYQIGFPVYKIMGNNHKIAIGYRGTLSLVNDIANLFLKEQDHE